MLSELSEVKTLSCYIHGQHLTLIDLLLFVTWRSQSLSLSFYHWFV